jgi:hypothetical protein
MVRTNPGRVPYDNVEGSVWVTRNSEMDWEGKEGQLAQVLDSLK